MIFQMFSLCWNGFQDVLFKFYCHFGAAVLGAVELYHIMIRTGVDLPNFIIEGRLNNRNSPLYAAKLSSIPHYISQIYHTVESTFLYNDFGKRSIQKH